MPKGTHLQSFIVAATGVFVLSAAVATFVGMMIAPSRPLIGASCKRICVEGENYICQFNFQIHRYQTYSWACENCTSAGLCDHEHCITADGVTRFMTAINRQLPGPSIEVCEGDTIRVSIHNLLPAGVVSLHWHGITHRGGNSHWDGVPGVTQCPVPPGATFTYTFKAHPSGTHLWYATTGFQKGDGVVGPLIVRKPVPKEEQRDLYNKDLSEHVILVQDWTHIPSEEKISLRYLSGATSPFPQSLLINGRGPLKREETIAVPKPVPYQRFRVIKDNKYRFRMVNGASLKCPISFFITNHLLTVISSDGSPIVPYNTTSLLIYPGERYDIVLNARQQEGSYWMTFMGRGDCAHAQVYQLAILDYVTGKVEYPEVTKHLTSIPAYKPKFSLRNFGKIKFKNTNANHTCEGEDHCLLHLHSSVTPAAEFLSLTRADTSIFLTLYSRDLKARMHGHPFYYAHTSDDESAHILMPQINNITFLHPTSPLIFDFQHTSSLCNIELEQYKTCSGTYCQCTHLIQVPLNHVVDLIITDLDPSNEGHTIHLHGYQFHVLHQSLFQEGQPSTMADIEQLHNEDQLQLNLNSPVLKDTVVVPSNGLTVLRFKADNPGFWLLHSLSLLEYEAGMKVVLQVGHKSDMAELPHGFPTCLDFL